MKPRVFVSFDYDNDKHYKFLLEAWHNNPKFEFVFDDATPGEIDSTNVGRIKAALTSKIKEATHVLVIIGEYANSPHRSRALIGYKNWINFEVHQAVEHGKRIAAIKLSRTNESPDELFGVNASWAFTFTENNIIKALEDASIASKKILRYV
jgi:hypothetical protein